MDNDKKKKSAAVHPAAFVGKVVDNPAAPPAVVLISGYPGASSQDGCSRFYLTPDLAFWIDVPNDAVVHVQGAGTEGEGNPFGAVSAWIRQDAKVTGGNRWSTAAPAAAPAGS